MNFRSKFVEISDHVSKPKFYYIENQILLHYESLADFDPKKCSKIWVLTRDHLFAQIWTENSLIEYVVKLRFSAQAITWKNPLSLHFMW